MPCSPGPILTHTRVHLPQGTGRVPLKGQGIAREFGHWLSESVSGESGFGGRLRKGEEGAVVMVVGVEGGRAAGSHLVLFERILGGLHWVSGLKGARPCSCAILSFKWGATPELHLRHRQLPEQRRRRASWEGQSLWMGG